MHGPSKRSPGVLKNKSRVNALKDKCVTVANLVGAVTMLRIGRSSLDTCSRSRQPRLQSTMVLTVESKTVTQRPLEQGGPQGGPSFSIVSFSTQAQTADVLNWSEPPSCPKLCLIPR